MTHGVIDISVVICAYTQDRWEDLVAAVASVRNQTTAPREIIIIIDHNEGLRQRAYAHFPNAVVVANSQSRGLSGARNTGIAAAQGAVVAFLDEDAVASPDWLDRLSVGYADPHVLGVGGMIKPSWVADRPRWFPKEFDWVVGCTYVGMPETAASVRNLIGANMSFRREIFDLIGGFRSGIGRIGSTPLGCEETELCIRLRQCYPGSTLLYEPQACTYHRVPGTRARWSYFCSRCYAEGRSKAIVARFVGAKNGLATERKYVTQILPHGILRSFKETAQQRNFAGLARAGTIVAGLAITAAGYLIGRISDCLSRWHMVRHSNQPA